MSKHRLYGVFLRYIYNFKHSIDRLSDAFFWPVVDLVLWGLTSRFFVSHVEGDTAKLIFTLLGGIILWIFAWRGQYEITVNLLEDLWNKNLVNLFATPLKFKEWVITLMFIGVGKAVVSFTFAALITYLLYRSSIFVLGWMLLPWAFLLIMFGWIFGVFISGIILRYGTKIQTLAWTSIYIIAPFSAIYYPVSSLPTWAQNIAWWVPTSYVFEGMRATIFGNPPPLTSLVWPFVLSCFYLTLALITLYTSFRHVLRKGLLSIN
jgi:ABC-2 type transport system permease protein